MHDVACAALAFLAVACPEGVVIAGVAISAADLAVMAGIATVYSALYNWIAANIC